MKCFSVTSPLLLLLLLLQGVFVGMPAVAGGVKRADYVQLHSIFPPILQNFWESGLRFWSFGLNTVVTDNYIRLTGNAGNAADAKGYFWNRHLNCMDTFEMNVTVQMLRRESTWGGDVRNGGIGIWYTTSERFTLGTDTGFFGFKRRFVGVGLILTHSEEILLVTNDGTVDLEAHNIGAHRHGRCKVPALGELHITISLLSRANTVYASYVYHEGKEPRPEDYSKAVLCASGPFPTGNESYLFGVTAANSAASQAIHEIHSIIMTPLSNISYHEEEEEKTIQFRLFASTKKVKEFVDGSYLNETNG